MQTCKNWRGRPSAYSVMLIEQGSKTRGTLGKPGKKKCGSTHWALAPRRILKKLNYSIYLQGEKSQADFGVRVAVRSKVKDSDRKNVKKSSSN